MNNKKRRRDIKSKLIAAICMLMVSTIMMVSTTYAWFTLSTAPEVTGINTSVGANGNLEMALLPTDGDTERISSAVGDSMYTANNTAFVANTTWGNLVDVSDDTSYGLGNITLMPSALNAADGVVSPAMLSYPEYGADGRVTELNTGVVTGTYDKDAGNFPVSTNFGVRAVGAASGMTNRQLAYRDALAAASTGAAQAKNTASTSLNQNGSALANIAIQHAANDGTEETYDADDVASLQAIVDDLLGTEAKTGALQYIEKSLKQYALALAASSDVDDLDAEETAQAWYAVQTAISSNTDIATIAESIGVQSFTDIVTAYTNTLENVTDANEALATLATATADGGTVSWTQISAPLNLLANTSSMKVNGIEVKDIKENMSALVNGVANGGLVVTMETGGGVYADIADFCGDYTASVLIQEVSYGGMTLNNLTARMETKTNQTPLYLTGLATYASGKSPESGDSTVLPISDYYGYIIDLAFRTNAANSNLLLQTDAVNRIYEQDGVETTMGGGASMTFKATTTDFGDDAVKGLMDCIRIVFFTPGDTTEDTGTVLGTAKLDMANAELTADGWKAGLYLYEQQQVQDDTNLVEDENGVAPGETGYVTTYGDKTTEVMLTGDDAVITALTQNEAQKVSVLVYLDGETITNADVANAATSMTGLMNLQFSSSATLDAMDYTPFIQQEASAG